MGQLDDGKVKGQNLTKMNLIVKRIEVELNQLKNLINEQIQSLPASTSANCDGNPDADENTGDSSIIYDESYCLVDTLKIENDQISTTENDDNDFVVNNYQQEFNEDQLNQNRSSNEDELILGGLDFNCQVSSKENEAHVNPKLSFHTLVTSDQYQDKVIISQVHSVDLKPAADLDLIQMSNDNLEENPEVAGKNDLKLSQKLIVQMGIRCEQDPLILQSNRSIDQLSQSKNKRNQKDGKTVKISSNSKGSVKTSHICSTCSKSFKDFAHLTRHIMVHTGERPIKCKICSKSFSRLDNFKMHNLVHTGEKPYSCSFCSKSFRQSYSRKNHIIKFHKDQGSQSKNTRNQKYLGTTVNIASKSKGSVKKSHNCSTCSKSFPRFSKLLRHMMVHTGEKPFKCKICSKSFNQISILKSHTLIHTGEKPYPCSICSKSFRLNQTLNEHMRIHTGERERPYSCSICSQVFSRSSDIKKHEKKFHGQE